MNDIPVQRKPFTGVWNIIRFNWHFYVLSAIVLVGLIFLIPIINEPISSLLWIGFFLALVGTMTSLLVSFYVYDCSGLYKFDWLDKCGIQDKGMMLNINAGFDETSGILAHKFKRSELIVFDFYDPGKHTEVSIKRARKAYPPFLGTIQVNTDHLPLRDNFIDHIFAVLSAHEIRDEAERIIFFREINRLLKPGGKVIITEHLRDPANFLAYNVGFFHFHSKRSWKRTFHSADFDIKKEFKITPFITTFILESNGASS